MKHALFIRQPDVNWVGGTKGAFPFFLSLSGEDINWVGTTSYLIPTATTLDFFFFSLSLSAVISALSVCPLLIGQILPAHDEYGVYSGGEKVQCMGAAGDDAKHGTR